MRQVRRSGYCLAAALSSVPLGRAAGQSAQAAPTVLRGVAYDSVRGRPLSNAFVTLDGGRSAESDARGRFQFDSVSVGEHVVSVQHATLDSLGFSGLAARVRVGDPAGELRELRIATPSFASMWSVACRGKASKDSGFVYGTVVGAESRRPIANAVVGVTWLALDVKKGRSVNMQQFAGAGRTNADGGYAICGVPVGLGLRMQASADSGDSGVIEMISSDLPVQRRDFAISQVPSHGAPRAGLVVGQVTRPGGVPIANARVFIEGDSLEFRTDDRGRFVARNIATGSRQIEAFAIGMSPAASVVDVTAGDTTRFAAQLEPIQMLDVVRVTGSPRARRLAEALFERRRIGLGYMRDSSQINPHGLLSSVFDQFPATLVQRSATQFRLLMKTPSGQWCNAQIFIDGLPSDQEWLSTINPADIAAVEAYPRGSTVPAEFTSRSVITGACGVAVIWMKNAFR